MRRRIIVTSHKDDEMPNYRAYEIEGEGKERLSAQDIWDAIGDSLLEEFGFVIEKGDAKNFERYDA